MAVCYTIIYGHIYRRDQYKVMQKLLTDIPGGKSIVVKTKNTTTSTSRAHSQIARNGGAEIQARGNKALAAVESAVRKKLPPNQKPASWW